MLKYVLIIILIFYPLLVMADGQDGIIKIKDGSEVRCMSGLVDEEFVENNFAGEYFIGSDKCVIIENNIARSGHLILHADFLKLHSPLYRFNKYIYVYGESPESPEPVLGTVTFLSDGSSVNQLIWQHDSRQAFFPIRK
ncbi:MAG: hypothetical protein Q7J24_00900 [Desulfomicrobium sp.]|nr:hypothetical protein [Desulfomicrobium sp.]